MKKINVEKLLKKIRTRKNEVVIENSNIYVDKKMLYSYNPWLEELLPGFQRK